MISIVNLSQSELLLSHWNEAVIAGTRSSINQLNLSLSKVGFMDLWFGGSPSAMDKYLKLIDYFHKYHYSPHISSFQHAVSCNLKPRYRYYRGLDYELVRNIRLILWFNYQYFKICFSCLSFFQYIIAWIRKNR